jgi:hypothetical protein
VYLDFLDPESYFRAVAYNDSSDFVHNALSHVALLQDHLIPTF